ncbi:pyruvate kinase alpha/beta domain-containing protein [Halalkaliarchaeum sp. AArc-GB]|uniref:pyruvate kinase alpha/beta domain-containing protein n=1 Tax=Halalkaliarchaeum sp. AArc-GB TaxID=3074078 RepID=UPI0028586117|nr:pyruvate kinase alpha/beta domain-containing protein [Halalkaliarchaeum sp. AArc-GB]MDR5672876.1 pyruvate kinase alpha/beta domain-containing protein [Halalkaliarchaeum sp. AArc-GB]
MIRTDDMGTEQVLEAAKEYAVEHGIDDVVVASTTGETGAMAADVFDAADRNLAVVGHSTGYREPNEQELHDEHVEAIESAGGEIFVGPMVFSNVGAPVAKRDGHAVQSVIANVLRLFGQGSKVAVECVLMACDAGLVNVDRPVLSIAGTGSGADTIFLIRSANSRDFYDLRVLEVVAKPADRENLPFY